METNNFTIRIENGLACDARYRMAAPINLCIREGWQTAIVGPNGSGKTLLVNTLLRQYPLLDNHEVEYGDGLTGADIRNITFRDSYGSADSTYFYQQRWNMTEMGESPIVRDAFPDIKDPVWRERLFTLFDLPFIWEKQLVTLSSGEMRKYQLARSLAVRPRMVIIDSPFIGLDAQTRDMLCRLLENLVTEWKMQIILVVSRREDIPQFITHVIEVHDRRCSTVMPVQDYMAEPEESLPEPLLPQNLVDLMHNLPENGMDSDEIVRCNKVTLQYENRRILNELDWTVRKGEHWALLGPNGSGKSALLSMVYADNPQSYACDIALFGRPRGTG